MLIREEVIKKKMVIVKDTNPPQDMRAWWKEDGLERQRCDPHEWNSCINFERAARYAQCKEWKKLPIASTELGCNRYRTTADKIVAQLESDKALGAVALNVVHDRNEGVWEATTPVMKAFSRWVAVELSKERHSDIAKILSKGNPYVDTLTIAVAATFTINNNNTHDAYAINRILRYYDAPGIVIQGLDFDKTLGRLYVPWPTDNSSVQLAPISHYEL